MKRVRAFELSLRAIERFKDNYEIQANGCLAISKLAKSGDDEQRERAYKLVMSARERFKDKDVQANGCLAIYELVKSGDLQHLRERACELMMSAMTCYQAKETQLCDVVVLRALTEYFKKEEIQQVVLLAIFMLAQQTKI
jgi:hypothetical protein